MNQTAIGNYIAKKRREVNLTQEQLAEKLAFQTRQYQNGKTENVCRITA